ncbi:hypothetical protein [Nocardioides convexus]|nr:hypothetical protein [Nocardioides convexus]
MIGEERLASLVTDCQARAREVAGVGPRPEPAQARRPGRPADLS